jgi:copper(I)-binding protein
VTLPIGTPDRAADEERPRPGRRPSAALLAATLAVLLGVTGLVLGARQDRPGQPAGAPGAPAPAAPADAVSVGDITVSGIYLRQPASPDVAAAYLSMRNAGSSDDALVSVYSGAARTTSLHGGSESVDPASMTDSGPITVPAGGTVTLSPGKGHIMLEGPTGPLRPGDRISMLLTFRSAGQLLVEAPVIAIGAPAPGGATS